MNFFIKSVLRVIKIGVTVESFLLNSLAQLISQISLSLKSEDLHISAAFGSTASMVTDAEALHYQYEPAL